MFLTEDVLKMVGAERSAIAPLGVTNMVAFSYRDPAIAADTLPFALEDLSKPGNYRGGLRFRLATGDVVIRKRTIKRILLWEEPRRTVPRARSWVWIVEAAEAQ